MYLGIIAVLPSKVYVERSLVINTGAKEVYEYLQDFRNFQDWAHWAQIDPDTKYEYEGPLTGVGSKMNWHSNHIGMGYGSWWITATTPNTNITSLIQLREFKAPAKMEFNLTEKGNSTHIRWSFQTNFYGHWKFYVSMMEPELGPAFEKGLMKVKENLENRNTKNIKIKNQ